METELKTEYKEVAQHLVNEIKISRYSREYRVNVGNRFRTHGMRKTRFYKKWCEMKYRCSNPNCDRYERYGGRGVKVCERWLNFSNFREDMFKSYLSHVQRFGERDTTIERIDLDGNYEPQNCTWATRKEQLRNTSRSRVLVFMNEAKPLSQWAEELGVRYSLIHERLRRGWSVTKALTTPKL